MQPTMQWSKVRALSFTRRLILVVNVSRYLLLRGIGDFTDFRWLSLAESWLQVLGVEWRKEERRDRAA